MSPVYDRHHSRHLLTDDKAWIEGAMFVAEREILARPRKHTCFMECLNLRCTCQEVSRKAASQILDL
ncbi:MAG: hypothetical protein ACYCTF_05050, partial [Acidiferrobacter sp.]